MHFKLLTAWRQIISSLNAKENKPKLKQIANKRHCMQHPQHHCAELCLLHCLHTMVGPCMQYKAANRNKITLLIADACNC